ncbi:hypothetical protein ACFVAE_15810 [Microbacterium sp. NPDC057659]|uniref:hypothetical protein n=1 Tax=Microbacterium sp. NPDC057659 TaxID=3346198 RepID=UPI00367156A7
MLLEHGEYLAVIELIRSLQGEVPDSEIAAGMLPGFDPWVVGAIRAEENDADAVVLLAEEYNRHGGHELLAAAMFKFAADRGSSDALEYVGNLLDWLGAYEQAIPYLRRARELDLTDPAMVAGCLGHALRETGHSGPEVEDLLREGAEVHDDFGIDFADVLIENEALREAAALLKRLTASSVYGAAIKYGNLLDDELDEPELAIEAYLTGIEQGDGHSAYNLALLYDDQGDDRLSAKYLALARKMGDMTAWPR